MRKNVYTILATGEAREVYVVEAESEDEARDMFEQGLVTDPVSVEVLAPEIESITRDR